jgi:hypothetical protein
VKQTREDIDEAARRILALKPLDHVSIGPAFTDEPVRETIAFFLAELEAIGGRVENQEQLGVQELLVRFARAWQKARKADEQARELRKQCKTSD